MILNNYFAVLKTKITKQDVGGLRIATGYDFTSKYSDSSSIALAMATVSTSLTNTTNNVIILGSGVEAPAPTDYKLSGNLITGITTQCTNKWNDDTGLTKIITITNSGDEAITIGEIGIVMGAYGSVTGYSSTTTWGVLVDRTVLESPLTIEAGGIGQITYTINVQMPEASTAVASE